MIGLLTVGKEEGRRQERWSERLCWGAVQCADASGPECGVSPLSPSQDVLDWPSGLRARGLGQHYSSVGIIHRVGIRTTPHLPWCPAFSWQSTGWLDTLGKMAAGATRHPGGALQCSLWESGVPESMPCGGSDESQVGVSCEAAGQQSLALPEGLLTSPAPAHQQRVS